MLTQAEIESYHQNGYLAVEGVFGAEEVEALQRVTDEFVEKSREVTEHTDVFDLEPGHTPEEPRLRRLKGPVAQHPVYDQALRNDRLLDLVEQLIGPGVRTNGNKLNMKLPEFGSPVEWHQDWGFYPHTNDDLLAVGVAIDDMNLTNGCLLVVPRSHKGPIYDHHQDGVFVGAVTESGFEPEPVVPVQVKAGGISIHHVRALHGSVPNRSDHPRRLLLLQYCSIDSWPVSGASWETFQDSILRGEPDPAIRVTEVPIRVPLPSSERTGSIYELQTDLKEKVLANSPSTD